MSDFLFDADLTNPELSTDQKHEELEKQYFQFPNIFIPIVTEKQTTISGFFALENRDLPESGQKYLNEITRTPFKAGLAGLTVFSTPFQPAVQENYNRALIMLANSIDRCDQSGHSQLTSSWAHHLACQIGLSEEEVKDITLAGRLHDIGKAVVSLELLTKPGPLTPSEWSIIQRHPKYSAALMEPAQNLEELRPMVRWHHEHFDGRGYPDGISDYDIPLGARILSVVDAYSTMVSGRAYRYPMTSSSALVELSRCSGSQFDPEIVKQMIVCVMSKH